jgi:hypothetical protein
MNEEMQREVRNAFKIQPGSNEKVPSVVPVCEVGSKSVKEGKVANVFLTSTSTSTTLFAAPTNQDTYVSAALICYFGDATATGTAVSMNCTINGASQRLMGLPGVTLNARTQQISLCFPHPVKVDRGTNITVSISAGTATFQIFGLINYYLDEQGNA